MPRCSPFSNMTMTPINEIVDKAETSRLRSAALNLELQRAGSLRPRGGIETQCPLRDDVFPTHIGARTHYADEKSARGRKCLRPKLIAICLLINFPLRYSI